MITFAFPRWQPSLALSSSAQTLARAPRSAASRTGCTKILCAISGGSRARSSCRCRVPRRRHVRQASAAGNYGHGIGESSSRASKGSGHSQRRRRDLRSPRSSAAVTAVTVETNTTTAARLKASIRDNTWDENAPPEVFDPARAVREGGGCDAKTEAVRVKVELLLRLKSMGQRFEWRGALKVFGRAKAAGIATDNSLYSCIIGVMAKSGRWSEAVDLLAEAREDGLDPPNEYCFTAAVNACAKGRNWKLALSLLDEMRDAGLSPDHVTYGSAVSAMAKAGQWKRALSLLRQMADEGLRPNVVCFGAAVDACAKGGEWEKAVALLEVMREAGVDPDRICYNTAINACAQSGEWEIALSLADEMRQASDGARPDAFTLNSVMHGMAGAGEWQRVLAIMDGMQARDGVAPDVVSYNTAMAACNKECQYELTLSTFDDMRVAGVTPDKESFSAATEACAGDTSGDKGVRAIELLRLARAEGIKKPAARAVAASLAACVGGGPWRRAIPAVQVMVDASGQNAWNDVMKFLADAQDAVAARKRGIGGVVKEGADAARIGRSLSRNRAGCTEVEEGGEEKEEREATDALSRPPTPTPPPRPAAPARARRLLIPAEPRQGSVTRGVTDDVPAAAASNSGRGRTAKQGHEPHVRSGNGCETAPARLKEGEGEGEERPRLSAAQSFPTISACGARGHDRSAVIASAADTKACKGSGAAQAERSSGGGMLSDEEDYHDGSGRSHRRRQRRSINGEAVAAAAAAAAAASF